MNQFDLPLCAISWEFHRDYLGPGPPNLWQSGHGHSRTICFLNGNGVVTWSGWLCEPVGALPSINGHPKDCDDCELRKLVVLGSFALCWQSSEGPVWQPEILESVSKRLERKSWMRNKFEKTVYSRWWVSIHTFPVESNNVGYPRSAWFSLVGILLLIFLVILRLPLTHFFIDPGGIKGFESFGNSFRIDRGPLERVCFHSSQVTHDLPGAMGTRSTKTHQNYGCGPVRIQTRGGTTQWCSCSCRLFPIHTWHRDGGL